MIECESCGAAASSIDCNGEGDCCATVRHHRTVQHLGAPLDEPCADSDPIIAKDVMITAAWLLSITAGGIVTILFILAVALA